MDPMPSRREQIAEYLRAGAEYDEIAQLLDVPKPLVLRFRAHVSIFYDEQYMR